MPRTVSDLGPDPATGLRRALDPDGNVVGRLPMDLSKERLLDLHRWMVFSRVFDDKMMALQRAGRIGFYGEARGQEAGAVGCGAALRDDDWVFPALREGIIMLMRGFPLEEFVAANYGNARDVMKGRQMPCHYAGRSVAQVSWSSSMATQLLHAAGAAYAAKLKRHDRVFMAFVGDGGTSESDFHAALNLAGVHKLPNVFVVQNNQWAISVPARLQTGSASYAIKARAYGFPGIRVDGNDILAVYAAAKEAIDRARAGEGPTLIETVTFRMGGHSSSDDATRYREPAVLTEWQTKDPLRRYGKWLADKGLLDEAGQEAVREGASRRIAAAVAAVETAPWPSSSSLFDDVYETPTPQLRAQREEMRRAHPDWKGPHH